MLYRRDTYEPFNRMSYIIVRAAAAGALAQEFEIVQGVPIAIVFLKGTLLLQK